MQKKTFVAGVVVLVLILGAGLYFWSGNKTETISPKQPEITIGYREHMAYLPLFIGLEKGLFDQADIKVNKIKFSSTNDLMDAILSGKIDASLGGVNTPVLASIDEKSPGEFKIFSTFSDPADHPASCFIAKKDSPIKSVADFKGKKIGLPPGSTPKVLLSLAVKNYFNEQDVTPMSMEASLLLSALTSGQIDAAYVVEPSNTIGKYKGVSQTVECGLWSKYFLQDMPLAASVVSAKFARDNPELAQKLVAITDEALQYAAQNPISAKAIIAQYTNTEEKVLDNLAMLEFKDSNTIDKNVLQATADKLVVVGELDKAINTGDWVYDATKTNQ